MSSRCPRCGADLPRVDGDAAAFCALCGLPQLRVSPEAVTVAAPPSAETPLRTGAGRPVLDWSSALVLLAVVGTLGAVGPSLVPGALAAGTAGGMSLMLMPLLVLVAVAAYHRSRPRRDVSPGIGGRLGAVLGLIVGVWTAFLTGVVGFVLRYRYHSHALDDMFDQSSKAMADRLQGSPVLPDAVRMSQSPEFHAASLMLGHLLSLLLLVFAGTVCGWLAGAVLRSRRERMVR